MFVIDPETDQLLHYEPVTGFPPTRVARIPREVLNEHPECEIRYDLIDCSIDICSIEVSTDVANAFGTEVNHLDFRSLRYSKTTLTTGTSGETSSTESSPPTF